MRASGILDDDGTGDAGSLVARLVLAVVVDEVGAGGAHGDDVAGDLDGEVGINVVTALGALISVGGVAGSLEDDLGGTDDGGGGGDLVDDLVGALLGDGVAGLVLALVLASVLADLAV